VASRLSIKEMAALSSVDRNTREIMKEVIPAELQRRMESPEHIPTTQEFLHWWLVHRKLKISITCSLNIERLIIEKCLVNNEMKTEITFREEKYLFDISQIFEHCPKLQRYISLPDGSILLDN
jgi:hypothetical protein